MEIWFRGASLDEAYYTAIPTHTISPSTGYVASLYTVLGAHNEEFLCAELSPIRSHDKIPCKQCVLTNPAISDWITMTGSTVCQKDPSFYTKAAASGALAACFTHVIMVPLDVVKTRMQLSPTAYPNAATAVRTIRSNEGIRGLTLGLGPTNYGYLTQGAFKYGLYELFKTNFPKLIGQQRAEQNATLLYLAAGMTAEAIADIFLTPFEAVRIRMVSQPGFASGTIAGMRKVVAMEGVRGLYKGFAPLLMKQVPYTAVKLATFEACEEFLYSHLKREEMSNGAQLAVTTVSGFVGGVASAVVSHPADTMLTKINVTEGGLGSVLRQTGITGIWAGLLPRMGMVGVLAALQLLVYDAAKVTLFGLPTSQGIKTHSLSKGLAE